MSVILRAFHDTKKSGSRMPIWGVWHPLIGWQRARKHGNATLLHFDDFWYIRRSQLGNSKSFETSAKLTASASLIIYSQDGLPMFHVCVELEGCISDSASSIIVMFPQNPTMGLSETRVPQSWSNLMAYQLIIIFNHSKLIDRMNREAILHFQTIPN